MLETTERRRLARHQFTEILLPESEAVEVDVRELEDLLNRAMASLERGLRIHQLTDQFVKELPPYVRYQLDFTRARELILLQNRQRQRVNGSRGQWSNSHGTGREIDCF